MTARDAILAALADRPRATPERIAAEARALIAGLERPATTGAVVDEFIAKLSVPSIGATHDAVPDWRALPAAVRAYLSPTVRVERSRDTLPNDAERLRLEFARPGPSTSLGTNGEGDARALYLPPDPRLATLDWTGIDRLDTIPVDDAVALAVATAGVAETGSLVLDTGPHAPMLPNFLALHHLVAVERASLVRFLDEVPPPAAQPRTRYWVTGVSGTTDIEGQYVRGAHGPRFLHVILIG